MEIPSTDWLYGRSLILGETVIGDFRDTALRDLVRRYAEGEPFASILDALKQLGHEYLPIFAEQFIGADMAAWLTAYQWHYKKMPKWLQQHIAESNTRGRQPPSVPTIKIPGRFGDDPRKVRFPLIEQAAKSLFAANAMTREEFDDSADASKRQAFTIAGDLTNETIAQVRDTLAELIRTGPTLKLFRDRLSERFETSRLGPGHVENVYRTNIQSAYRDGRESLMSNPIVADVFPYQEYVPIHDGRVRPEHLALGTLGLNGTGIYRRDDPIWDYFTPPWDYNCRCAVIPLTLEAAARRGVKEAKDWLELGIAPRRPEFRFGSIPFSPNPGFGHRSGRGLIAA